MLMKSFKDIENTIKNYMELKEFLNSQINTELKE